VTLTPTLSPFDKLRYRGRGRNYSLSILGRGGRFGDFKKGTLANHGMLFQVEVRKNNLFYLAGVFIWSGSG